jgi:hypothetical protein
MSDNIPEDILKQFYIMNFATSKRKTLISPIIKLLLIAIVLASCLTTMAVVINPVLAYAGISFKNKSECMEYAMDGTKVVKNHTIQSAKVSKQLAEKLCAEYLID